MRTIVGIDTGGTFTDFVVLAGRRLRTHKLPSTPADPSRAVLQGLRTLFTEDTADYEIVHGSTVATNALLERKGARTALVTTAGFGDLLLIGRQARSAIYDIEVDRQPPLVPPERCLEIEERVGAQGEVLVKLEAEAQEALARVITTMEVDAVAICLLHSYAHPDHEQAIAATLQEVFAGYLSVSHEILPEFREYERCCATLANAYVGPVMATYLQSLAKGVGDQRLRIMQSNGGSLTAEAAKRQPVRTILSGPAGGVVGGFEVSKRVGIDNVVTFDMGGTSTDVSLCPGQLGTTSESQVGDLPIRLPVLDIHTVGAGGGSIAYIDPGGGLRVGPQSAGAEPGPICYDRGGTELTVTDANLYLGRLSGRHFLGGTQELRGDPVELQMQRLATDLRIDPSELAHGILEIANTTMEGALRVISVERGYDPRDFCLVCFGGAGGMHAAALATVLSIPKVLVPRGAGTLSALGMLLADKVRDYSQTHLRRWHDLSSSELEELFGDLEARARDDQRRDAEKPEALVLERQLDLRYVGQGYELTVPYSAAADSIFHRVHEQRYGYCDPGRSVELVNVRLRSIARTHKPELELQAIEATASADCAGEQIMIFEGVEYRAPMLLRRDLRPGDRFDGPALFIEYGSSTVLPPGWCCDVDGLQNLVLVPQVGQP